MTTEVEQPSDTDELVRIRGLAKSFDAVQALRNADLTLMRGEVTALLGDNGAGKSTLVRCLTGVHPPDTGTIEIAGEPIRFHSPEDARRIGIETVYQDLALIEDLTVWQNLFLRREIVHRFGPFSMLHKKAMRTGAAEVLASLQIDIPTVKATVRRMSGGQRQSIAIARAAHWGRMLVVMDEPTAALGVRETAAVESLIAQLRATGVTVLLISHDMAQVMRVADVAVVLRRGTTVARRRISEATADALVALITGADPGGARE